VFIYYIYICVFSLAMCLFGPPVLIDIWRFFLNLTVKNNLVLLGLFRVLGF
jgi:hypothetical protein